MQMTFEQIREILIEGKSFQADEATMARVRDCHTFLQQFANDRIIYGINTGFGPMAQWRVEDAHLEELQYNIIRSHSTGAGEPLDDLDVKAAMIARVGSFLQARSGVHPEIVELLQAFINRGIYPFIPRHGSVGASGDLVQLAHIALCLIGEGKVHYRGEWKPTAEVMSEEGLQPIHIHVREGLSATNGTSVMTGIGAVNQLHAENLLRLALLASVWMNEIAESYDDLMSEQLNACRRHEGQQTIAAQMRAIAKGSKRLPKREHALYDGGHTEHVFAKKVQAYYSLRCIPQIMGPVWETLGNARRVIEEEFNSASDNPIVDYEAGNVYHGGNFHGDYISLEQDKVKIAVTRMVMTAERQLNYLFHDRINDGIMPPFLNRGVLGLNYGMQACQFTATSTTAECQTLSMPNYVHSIPNNNDNQDIVSMGTNSALLCRQVIENAYQVFAILFMALAQSTDILSIADQMAPATRAMYNELRTLTDSRIEDRPFYEDITRIIEALKKKI